MKKPGTFPIVIALLGASLLAACGKPAPPNANPKSSDACTLLAKDDVSKVLGQAVEEVTAKGLGGVCEYKTKNMILDLTVVHSGGARYMQETRAKLGQSALALDVPGLGDGAFYNVNSFVNTLFVGKGDAVYLITVSNDPSLRLSPEDKRAKEKALAEHLIGSLH